MPESGPEQTSLSKRERDVLAAIAHRDGISEDEAATNLVKAALARMVKRRTGRVPAKVYGFRRK